jgi:hypothetical protein
MRHRVAHTGYRPTIVEAKDAYKICVDVVQWLCAVAGAPVKPLLPAPEDTYPGITEELRDKLPINPLEQELLIHLLSVTRFQASTTASTPTDDGHPTRASNEEHGEDLSAERPKPTEH